MTTCIIHPGGETELPDSDFSPSQIKRGRGYCRACMMVYKREYRKRKAEQAGRVFVSKPRATVPAHPGTIVCTQHPGGPTALPLSFFVPSYHDRKRAICKECQARLDRARRANKESIAKSDQIQTLLQRTPPEASPPVNHPNITLSAVQVEEATAMPMTGKAELPVTEPEERPRPRLLKIGRFHIAEQAILLAEDVNPGLAAAKLILYTTLLEVDSATKHPRNKRIMFDIAETPREYEATAAWLRELEGGERGVAYSNMVIERDTALRLAEETERANADLQRQVTDLRQKLDSVRSLLSGYAPERIKG